jgi:hypothetical protein
MKTFTRTTEDFTCENCGMKVTGNGYTNHCPACLFSKHVDINPGDRAQTCLGLMEPVGFDQKKGILHRCTTCQETKFNKLQDEDNFQQVIVLSAVTK